MPQVLAAGIRNNIIRVINLGNLEDIMKKIVLVGALVAGVGFLSGCRTNYYDYAFGAQNRYEAQQYDRTLSGTGVDTSIRSPVVAQPGINRDSDPVPGPR
jgi:hypothetical protein